MEKFYNGVNRKNTNCIKWDLVEDCENDILPFSIADSDYPTCDSVLEALEKRIKEGAFGYTIIDDEYYMNIQNWFKERHNYEIKKEWILPSPGVVTALYLAVKLFTKEDAEVIVSNPVYNPFFDVIRNNDRKLSLNKLIKKDNTYEIDFDDLEEKMKTAEMYIFCNPHNPVGRCWKKEEVEKVVSLCKKYDVILVSDEIHCDLIMEDNKFYSLGHYLDEFDNLIICTAPSKTFNIAGLQDANIIIKNKKYFDVISKYLNDMSVGRPNLLALTACKAAYGGGKEWVDMQNKYLTEQRDIAYKFFEEKIPNALVTKLEGTYLMWIDMGFLKLPQEELISGLRKSGIIVNCGTTYCQDYIGYIRLNIACPREQLLKGLDRIYNFVLSKIGE